MRKPHFPLDRVKELVRNDQLWICKGRGLNNFPTPRAGIRFAKALTARMTEDNFAQTVSLHQGKADVYGICEDGVGWYIKLDIDPEGPEGDEVTFISLHPLERPLQTNSGRVEP